MTAVVSLSTRLLVTSCVAALLSGCASNAIFPDSGSPLPESVPLGSFQGSVYGGHAPIVNSKIFVLQAGTGGYGGKAVSLLDPPYATASQPEAVTLDTTTTDPTYNMSYVTTNAQGYFNVSGDYACTPGLPVYLYSSGGVSSLAAGNGLTGYTVSGNSITFTAYNLVSVGQNVSFVGMPAALNGLNSGSYPVTAATAENVVTNAAGSFTITAPGYTTGGAIALAPNNSIAYVVTGNSNPAIVNLAVLGNCPTSGAANFSSLSFVYMNEVSTVAAAYALSGFFSNSATQLASTDAVHLSIPVEGSYAGIALGTSPAWVAIENAANNAGQLYDIQGTGMTSATGNGEGHIANLKTPSGGTVSQAVIDAIANALAACVDSGNTATTPTAPCTTLLADALPLTTAGGLPYSNTTYSKPKDVATAAINLAHNPWTLNATAILNLVNQTSPYAPSAASVNDLSVTITYPLNTGTPAPNGGGVAIDADGNAWVTNYTNLQLTKFSPLGVQLFQRTLPEAPGMVALDSTGNAWVALRGIDTFANVGVDTGAYEYTSNGTLVTGSPFLAGFYPTNTENQGLFNNVWVAVDGNDNAYFPDHVFNSVVEVNKNGVYQNVFQQGADNNTNSTGWNGPLTIALDSSGDIFSTIFPSTTGSHGVEVWKNGGSTTAPSPLITTVQEPIGIAIDAAGNAWNTDLNTNAIWKLPKGGTALTQYTSSGTSGYGNGGVKSAIGIAIDPAGLIYVSSPTGASTGLGNIAVFNTNSTVYVTGSNGITGAFTSGGTVTPMAAPYFIAPDNAGNLWAATSGNVVEYIGMSTPVLTPLSANLKKGVNLERP